jgi:hypothetical protein
MMLLVWECLDYWSRNVKGLKASSWWCSLFGNALTIGPEMLRVWRLVRGDRSWGVSPWSVGLKSRDRLVLSVFERLAASVSLRKRKPSEKSISPDFSMWIRKRRRLWRNCSTWHELLAYQEWRYRLPQREITRITLRLAWGQKDLATPGYQVNWKYWPQSAWSGLLLYCA